MNPATEGALFMAKEILPPLLIGISGVGIISIIRLVIKTKFKR